MRRSLFLLLLLLIVVPGAKSQGFEYSLNKANDNSRWRKKVMEAHINGSRAIKIYPRKKATQFVQYDYQYNKNGNITEEKEYNRRKKLIRRYSFAYDSKFNQTEYIEFRRNGKIKRKFTYEYNDSGYVTRQNFYWKNADKIGWYSTKKFDANNKILEYAYYYPTKKGDKIGTHYKYSYYPDGSRKQTIEYNAKGKIEHEWNYECNPEGSIDTKKLKDTSKVCVRYETDKYGNKITIKEEFVKSGRTVRIISKYNSAGNMIEYISFDKKGHERYKTIYDYDKNQDMKEFKSFSKGKLTYRYVYECDANGFITKSYTYTKSDTPDFIMNFEYEHY